MKKVKSLLAIFLVLFLILPTLFACDTAAPADGGAADTTAADVTSADTLPADVDPSLNGLPLSEYTIIYSESGFDFNKRAAEYISSQIEALVGTAPEVKLDTETEITENEILVGITNRQESLGIDSVEDKTEGFEFLSVSKDDKVLLYGKEYMIAGAAYNLIKELSEKKVVTVPAEITVGEPVFEEAKNIIYVIGDGMGFNSLELGNQLYESGEYAKFALASGNYPQNIIANDLPYKGQHYTHSYNKDVTDSAAGGTALATGYKTYNGVLGLDKNLEPVKNLTELAQELGKKTAVITSDEKQGATPAAFSIHASGRYETEEILSEYEKVTFDFVIDKLWNPAETVREVLDSFDGAENGFFIMHEEADIDANAHKHNYKLFYTAYARLNSSLRIYFEYMMYNPDTLLILTADHETGGVLIDEETGKYDFTEGDHTQVNVPLYAIGAGTEFIHGKTFDNTGVAKFVAQLMGVNDFGDPELEMLTDKTGLEKLTKEEKSRISAEEDAAYAAYNAKKNGK
ncbi:MAG: alkaline phosphatase [Clostridia bacterium]|nr:alkaline phosphatase [Clostridia bacterium]